MRSSFVLPVFKSLLEFILGQRRGLQVFKSLLNFVLRLFKSLLAFNLDKRRGLVFISAFFKKLLFVVVAFFSIEGDIKIKGLSLIPNTTEAKAEAEEETCEDDLGEECNSCLEIKAKKAASGMDPASVMLMTTTIGQASSSAKDAGTAQKATGGIATLLALTAARRYNKCSEAIDNCERKCDPIQNGCSPFPPPTPPSNEKYITCTNKKRILKNCIAQRSTCNEAGLQALISAIQAAMAFGASKKLCDGEDCEKKPTPTPPSLTPLRLPDTEEGPGFDGGPGGDNPPRIPPVLPKGDKKAKNKPKGKEKDFSGRGANFAGGGFSDNTSSGAIGGFKGSGAFDYSKLKSKGSGKEGEVSDGEEKYSPSGLTGAFTGGESGSSSSRGLAHSSSPQIKKKKLKIAKKELSKKADLKRDIFAGSRSIFEKMSRIIQSFCQGGTSKCQ